VEQFAAQFEAVNDEAIATVMGCTDRSSAWSDVPGDDAGSARQIEDTLVPLRIRR